MGASLPSTCLPNPKMDAQDTKGRFLINTTRDNAIEWLGVHRASIAERAGRKEQ